MRADPATAYAVSVNGKLDVNTVHAHARGAMVNWLHLHVRGFVALDSEDDETFRTIFLQAQRSRPDLQIQLQLLVLSPVGETNAAKVDLTALPVQPPASRG